MTENPHCAPHSEQQVAAVEEKVEKKFKANFELTGKLYAEVMTNANGVVAKYAEPADGAKPEQKWRIYVFKEGVEGVQGTCHTAVVTLWHMMMVVVVVVEVSCCCLRV